MYYTMGDMPRAATSPTNTEFVNTTLEASTTLKSTMSGAALKQFLERLIGLLEQAHTA